MFAGEVVSQLVRQQIAISEMANGNRKPARRIFVQQLQ